MWPLTGREIAEACGVSAGIDVDVSIAGIALSASDVRGDDLFIAVREGEWDGHSEIEAALARGARMVIAERGEPSPRMLLVEDSVAAFRKIAALLRSRFSFPVVAIGGSNGKTTTKELVAALLSGGETPRAVTKTPETMNGWTGIPLTLALREHTRAAPPAALVVEIGIDAVGAMGDHAKLVDADVAVITSLGAEHLAGLRDVATAVAEETKLFEGSARTRRVIHADDPHVAKWLERATLRDGDLVVSSRPDSDVIYEIAAPSPASVEVTITLAKPAKLPKWRGTFALPLAGRHNGQNFALAFAAALAVGRTPQEIAAGLASFVPPSMRCELRTLGDGSVLVDDAYNANPSSMEAAFALLSWPGWSDRTKVLVLGDMLELGAESEALHLGLCAPLRALVAEGARVFLHGDEMRAVHRALEGTTYLARDADPRRLLDDPVFDREGVVLLVKGSRGMHLERVVEALLEDPRRKTKTTEADVLRFAGRFKSACVTGTNGKTTTTSLIAAITAAAGETSCRVTTLGSFIGDERVEAEASGPAFVRTLARAAKRDVKTIAVETTSHALAGGFARTWPANVAVLTNFSRDHLDYHGSPEEYLAAKAQLFMGLDASSVAVLNVADPASALLDEIMAPEIRRLGYAARTPEPSCSAIPLELFALPEEIMVDETGTHARLAPSALGDALGGRIDLSLVGAMHVENALAAALAAHALGCSADAIRIGLSSFRGVEGRFQVVHGRPIVVVDYAHTPDALVRTLGVARSLVAARQGKVLLVFGCGGHRDAGKRSEMGAVASTSADVVIVTNDNPRNEDPASIADAIEAGARKGAADVRRILDRSRAIRCAVELAAPSDIVVIAGKGHEKTQVIGGEALPFDDVVVARLALAADTERG